jgi:hypothetical protein
VTKEAWPRKKEKESSVDAAAQAYTITWQEVGGCVNGTGPIYRQRRLMWFSSVAIDAR